MKVCDDMYSVKYSISALYRRSPVGSLRARELLVTAAARATGRPSGCLRGWSPARPASRRVRLRARPRRGWSTGRMALLQAHARGAARARPGRAHAWAFYRDGKLLRRERDTDGDGRADTFEPATPPAPGPQK